MFVASESSQTDVLEYIITHIFCPIQLPQHNDYTLDNDRALLDVVLGSARKFVGSLPDHDQEQWSPSLRMLENLAVTMTSPSLTADVIEPQIKSMQGGGMWVVLAPKIDILKFLCRYSRISDSGTECCCSPSQARNGNHL
jgi:hypothetical protein